MSAAAPPSPLPWEAVTRSGEETERWGGRLAELVAPGDVIRLEGELGAGKTTFTRGLAAGLGADPAQVHSPSYSLVHLYRDADGRPVLYHADLYRIESAVDLREVGLEDVLASRIPTAVEWPERLATRHAAAPDDLHVRIEILSSAERRLTIRRGP